jgi:uncharacterized protein
MRFLACLFSATVFGQNGFNKTTYHDEAKRSIKEVYQVKDTISNSLQGRYISYFLNGNIESKGQFSNNETTGVWDFYYETGNLRMRGILRQNSNYGNWEYFYESGKKSMEGIIDGRQRSGSWKIYYESGELKEVGEYVFDRRSGLWTSYFEDGKKRGEIEYKDDHGRCTEYYPSGKIFGEGPRAGSRNVGIWRFYSEDGYVESEGEFVNGKKSGEWKKLYPTGKTLSIGKYENDEPTGIWTHYFEDGSVNSKGEYVEGKKQGYWSTFSKGGVKRSEITYNKGTGEYREYYPNGKLKTKGIKQGELSQGAWQYFYEDGKLEGDCQFENGKGIYTGYYPNGSLQTKGKIEDNLRVGTWELYEQDGKLSGYYKPFYDDTELVGEIEGLVKKSKANQIQRSRKRTGFFYFTPLFPEYHGVIVAANPAFSFIGSMPISIEFYNQERLGHEFSFVGIRDPFYTADADVATNKTFLRGYSIAVKQKFYNSLTTGMWYFGHQVQLTNISHLANTELAISSPQLVKIVASASEQRAEYGIFVGLRLMEKNNGNGFTIDTFAGYNVGYRSFDIDPQYASIFNKINQSSLAQSFNFGINFGYSFSFDGRK